MDVSTIPGQPDESSWGFVQDLSAPLWTDHGWSARDARANEVSVADGFTLERFAGDPEGLLDTAYADLAAFAAAGRVPYGAGYRIGTRKADLPSEAFRVRIGRDGTVLEAGDTEGIRRGIFHLEDLMLRAGGPFLPLGEISRKPFITRRISRCFFGPIKRPPRMRDELMDDEDYYPGPYLDRLAHEGVNGLWLTVEFRDLCSTSVTPEYGRDAEKRLAKLSRTVEACRRYGIRTYVFCIEPRAWDADDAAILARHPDLAQGSAWGGRQLFCPFSAAARQYLYEATSGLFRAVPHLGGLINITHGERSTTCLSALAATGEGSIRCPVCSRKEPWEILYASLSAMEEGMHESAPDADLISWLYMPQPQGEGTPDLADWVYDIPKHTPPGVILQFNFESGVRREVFGKELVGGDYWLSNPGPSDRFERVAGSARVADTAVSAKIQTGCSHEVATVPFVPIPGMIYRKFAAMRRLGVSASMLCWYFGNYPGVMNKAAGELSFEPFPETEEAFLQDLAALWWGSDSALVVDAWQRMAAGYEHYPLTNLFQYYGPMHDGPVWPLHLEPADAPLSPTWQIGSAVTREPWPPSGDRVGEAFGEALTLEETVELCRRIHTSWDEGVAILKGVLARWMGSAERRQDVGVAEALGIQFRSGHNIMRFYQLRERMLRLAGADRADLLEAICAILRDEVAGDERLLELCLQDSRLGFHSEAEGYKYFPAKIRWRMGLLRGVLDDEVPVVSDTIRRGEALFPGYTGQKPDGPTVRCPFVASVESFVSDPDAAFPDGLDIATCQVGEPGGDAYRTEWAFCRDAEGLRLLCRCGEPHPDSALKGVPEGPFAAGSWRSFPSVALRVEPRRLWPCLWFALAANGAVSRSSAGMPSARTFVSDSSWHGILTIPFALLGRNPECLDPLRIDMLRSVPGKGVQSWLTAHPMTPRLRLGTENPSDLGWLLFT